MKGFLVKIGLFLFPLLWVIPMEMSVRQNSYQIKSKRAEARQDSVRIMLLGSSMSNKGINPEYVRPEMISLANDGSTLNLDRLLFDRYLETFPNLEMVIFELSYHTLEDRKPNTWNKNHLFLTFYGVNNYGKDPALSEHFLMTSNPREYLKRYLTPEDKKDDSQFNAHGFVLNSESRFAPYDYDSIKIAETSLKEYMGGRHEREQIDVYHDNIRLLNEAIDTCLAKNIKVVLLSPPKHYLYNQRNKSAKVERLQNYLQEVRQREHVYVLNYDQDYQYQTELFLNEDHLNLEGSTEFSKRLSRELNTILEADSQ